MKPIPGTTERAEPSEADRKCALDCAEIEQSYFPYVLPVDSDHRKITLIAQRIRQHVADETANYDAANAYMALHDKAKAALESAQGDKDRLEWLEAQANGLIIWRGILTKDGSPIVDIHEPREDGLDDACGEELSQGPSLRAAIDSARGAKEKL
jgi:hypothetical protein